MVLSDTSLYVHGLSLYLVHSITSIPILVLPFRSSAGFQKGLTAPQIHKAHNDNYYNILFISFTIYCGIKLVHLSGVIVFSAYSCCVIGIQNVHSPFKGFNLYLIISNYSSRHKSCRCQRVKLGTAWNHV
jgi:hypothetical protein